MTEIDDRVRLAPEPASAGTARRFVAHALDGCDVDLDLVALLVSELVTNVVLHRAHAVRAVGAISRAPHPHHGQRRERRDAGHEAVLG